MQTVSPSVSLQPVHDVSDLWVDAFLADDAHHLVFASVWGRDTAVQELLARLSLTPKEGGLDGIRIGNHQLRVSVDKLTKLTGRMPRDNIFGDLVHTWLYDGAAIRPDGVNRRAMLLYRETDDGNGLSLDDRLWAVVKETCHLPLLDHWRDAVLAEFSSQGWISHWSGTGISAYAVRLGGDEVEPLMTQLVRSGRLRLEEGDTSPLPDMSAPEEPDDDSPFGDVIYAYTRAQALEDGVLVDVSERAAELGFRYPVALTRAVWEDCIAWSDADTDRQTYQDEKGSKH